MTRTNPVFAISAALTAAFLASAAAAPEPGQAAPKPAPPAADVVVDVDGAQLTQPELDAMVRQTLRSKGMDRLPPDMLFRMKAELEPKMIAGFVSKVLLENDASRRGMKASRKEVDDAMSEIKANFPDPAAFAAILKQNDTTEAELRADIATDIRIKQVIAGCTSDLSKVSADDIRTFYEEEKANFKSDENVHARHILVAFAEGDSDQMKTEKKAVAEKIRKKIVDGSDFATVAQDHSDCPSSKAGGDLGTFGRGRMAPAFEKAAFSQKVDEIGPIVTTQFGHHIIQVLAHTPAATVPLKDVSDRISEYLASQRKEKAILDHIENLKKTAKIKYGDPQPKSSN